MMEPAAGTPAERANARRRQCGEAKRPAGAPGV
jgi:hypothetical protein